MNKIALAMIVKGDEKEAAVLDRCLDNVLPYVDAAFIVITYKSEKTRLEEEAPILKVTSKYAQNFNINYSSFKWINDFAAARNHGFSNIPKEYDYILWCDADDVFRGLDQLKKIIEENKSVDAFAFNYLYDFDTYQNPIVVHKKTQVVRNDGCVKWVGKLHEDFFENRALNVQFVSTIERIHLTDDERVKNSQVRNIEVSKEEAKINPDDPRVYFNLANSYFGAGKARLAKAAFLKFIQKTGSDDEKYIAYQRLSAVEKMLGNKEKAIEYLLLSIGMQPDVPDSYNLLGYLYFDYNMLDKAEFYLLLGLAMKPKYHKMIVYNPREYDYNPMMALAKVYFNKARPDYALPLLKGCLKIYPKDERIKGLVDEMEKENERQKQVIDAVKHIDTLEGDKEKILYTINKLPIDLQSHPAICRIKNKYFIKETSTGKDIAYYCGETKHEWNPIIAQTKGIGGSEEAVINLSLQWAKLGYNVTVFNSCGVEPLTVNGVTYKPFWHYNPKDKYDYTILWRSPRLADHELNTRKLYVDLHDVISEGEFNEKRLGRIDKIFVKTKAHKALFPRIPDEKFALIPNGQDFELFNQKVEKNPYLLVNTSSPDRSMDVLPRLFKEVKKRVPQARLKWAYGWEIYNNAFAADKDKINWRDKIIKEMEEAGIETVGRLSQRECAKLYLEGIILAYPSEFYEIDCISVKKAQAAGCKPITTDFAAFDESVQYGIKIHSKKTKENWNRPYQFSFGLEGEKEQKEWIDAVVKELQRKDTEVKKFERDNMKVWSYKFDWPIIAKTWIENL